MNNWKDSLSPDDKVSIDPRWYYVPQYANEGHKVVDSAGQEVATFEMKEHALACVSSYNQNIGKSE